MYQHPRTLVYIGIIVVALAGIAYGLTHHSRGTSLTVFVRAPGANVTQEVTPIEFRVEGVEDPSVYAEYSTKFNGPKR
jgi:hypothetical protein